MRAEYASLLHPVGHWSWCGWFSFPSGKKAPDKGMKSKRQVKVEADLAGRSSDYSVGRRGRAGRDRSKGEWWRRVGVAVFFTGPVANCIDDSKLDL
jgi:hypothetical protein